MKFFPWQKKDSERAAHPLEKYVFRVVLSGTAFFWLNAATLQEHSGRVRLLYRAKVLSLGDSGLRTRRASRRL
jgi:hypothetical protein